MRVTTTPHQGFDAPKGSTAFSREVGGVVDMDLRYDVVYFALPAPQLGDERRRSADWDTINLGRLRR